MVSRNFNTPYKEISADDVQNFLGTYTEITTHEIITKNTTTDNNDDVVVTLQNFGIALSVAREISQYLDTIEASRLINHAHQHNLGTGWLVDVARNLAKRPPLLPKTGSEVAARARKRQEYELAQLNAAAEATATAEIVDADIKRYMTQLANKCSLPVNL